MPTLSKSKFLAGHQCPKRLWLEVHEPELAPPPSPAQQRIFDQGHEVGELAQEGFIGGVLIAADHLHIPDALEDTRLAMAKGNKILFEPAFEFDDVLVRVDILDRLDNGSWHLIEVKSTTRVKDEHIHDVAIQAYVLGGAEIKVGKISLMHLNRECTYPDLSNLFTLEDISDQVNVLMPALATRVADFRQVVDMSEAPDIGVGRYCTSPYDCPFSASCWEGIPPVSMYSIPRLHEKKLIELAGKDITALEDIPEDYPLTNKQWEYVNFHKNREVQVDWETIRAELDVLEYPLYFLDFETDSPAVPGLVGMHPYEQFPFQFSCHILHEGGTLKHYEYLHEDITDPREPLTEALLEGMGEAGSVVVYNANFEKRVLQKLAGTFPGRTSRIEAIAGRLWDQLAIFRRHYRDYRFKGSNSLKSVLPVLVPSMDYASLAVSEGTEARVAWNTMIRLGDRPEKNKLRKDLLAYCGQDTLGMVEIHRYLTENCSGHKREKKS